LCSMWLNRQKWVLASVLAVPRICAADLPLIPRRSASLRSVPCRCTPLSFAPDRFAMGRSASVRFACVRSAPLRSAPPRSAESRARPGPSSPRAMRHRSTAVRGDRRADHHPVGVPARRTQQPLQHLQAATVGVLGQPPAILLGRRQPALYELPRRSALLYRANRRTTEPINLSNHARHRSGATLQPAATTRSAAMCRNTG
jgi:hypothetical protein